MSEKKRLVIIGGGAAGFFSAINAAQMASDLEVIILEKTHKLLSKVRISGGGRCNVTHQCFDNKLLAANYPRGNKELLSCFHQFNASDTIEWFSQRKIKLKAEPDGRMFPDTDSSETIIHCFLNEADKLGVTIKTGVALTNYSQTEDGRFILNLSDKTTMHATFLLIASGGHPAASSYSWICNSSNHTIINPTPSLFTFNIPNSPFKGLEGVATEVTLTLPGYNRTEQGPLLITHWGLSGPVVLRMSAWAAAWLNQQNYLTEVSINFLPGFNHTKALEKFAENKNLYARTNVATNKFFTNIPNRLWERLIDYGNIDKQTQYAQLSKKQINTLINLLVDFRVKMNGKTTFKEEFVTCGGVHLTEINMKTMESKIITNLFFAGEVINVDGITGGFNFQAAWSTAMIAARNIATRCYNS